MSKFNIGDKVRVTKQEPFCEAFARVGDVGIITAIIDPHQGHYHIDFKGHEQQSGRGFDNLELADKESDMENIKLQPGDYTTREEIKSYAERVGIPLKHAYLRICDALVTGGADIGEGVDYTSSSLNGYGWSLVGNEIYFGDSDDTVAFTRHLAPEQILNASKQEDLQSEKQADEVAPKQVGELTVGLNVELVSDLQTIISDYMYLLDSIKDPFARGVIHAQLTDLTDLQYKQLKGDTNA